MLSFDPIELIIIELFLLLTLDRVDPRCLFLHSLESLLILDVDFVTSHLIDQILDPLMLKSLFLQSFFVKICFHLYLLIQVGLLHIRLTFHFSCFIKLDLDIQKFIEFCDFSPRLVFFLIIILKIVFFEKHGSGMLSGR